MASNETLGTKKSEQEQGNENFVTRFLTFFQKYQNIIYGVIIGILVIVLAFILFNKFYIQKKTGEASAAIVQPINWMSMGDTVSLQKALEGDDDNSGFLDIANGYKLTKTSNTANYYAGLCYLKMGQKEDAMRYFKKFKKKENVMWYACQQNIADLYDENGDAANAIKYYKKAIKGSDPYATPNALFKLAKMYERENKWAEAADLYKAIEDRFYAEYNKMSIAQHAERAKANASK